MNPGSIVYFEDFKFPDGSTSNKLIIVLSKGGKEPYLCVLTTSQPYPSRPPIEGCHQNKGYYYFLGGKNWFKKDTWILLYKPYLLDASQFLQAKFDGRAEIKHCLDDASFRAIKNCFLKSPDCSDYYKKLLK